MDMAMNMLSTADMSNETQQLPLHELSSQTSIQRSESVLSDAPTYRDDIPTVQVHPPQVILQKSPELIRTHSCPPHTPEEALGVIPVPEQFNEQATRRMEWIMQMGMDTLLPTLRPEQRKIIEGTTDLWQLLVPLLQSWEHFRATDGRKTKAQKLAKSVYEKVKTNFTNNEIFQRFWEQKMVAEQDESGWRRFKGLVSGMLQQVSLIDRILDSAGMGNAFAPGKVIFGVVILFVQAAQKTYDAYEMIAETFEKMYLFVLRLQESLSARLITSTMMETYALATINVFKIILTATKYAQFGNRFYWKAMFDPQDDLYKLIARFNQLAVQQILSQVSQISVLLERHHHESFAVLEGISKQVGLLRQEQTETFHHVRRASDLLGKLAADGARAEIRTFHEEIETLRKWLKVPPNTEDDFTNFKSRKMRGTCEWIFEDDRFKAWLTSSDPATALLWIHARAGRGKSVLAATIVHHLQHYARKTGDSCVYFFCRSDDEAKKTPRAILRSTAYWLAQRNATIRRRLMEFWSNYPDLRIEELPLASLWDRLFMQCICDQLPADVSPFRIYWIVDALDECESNERLAFTKMLAELGQEHCGVPFRLLFLSRYVQDIAKVVDTEMIPIIEMKTSDNVRDIQKFIEANIRTSSLGSLNETDRERVIATLKERANGSFLWIKLVMEELEGKRSMRYIEEMLSEIPANRSLEDIYQRKLDSLESSCDQEDLDVAREIFLWTLCSPRPLNLDELTAALEASMETRMMDVERAVRETCDSLIEVVEVDVHSQKQVAAVHITLREFMQSEKATGWFAFSKAKAHARIARSCIKYLLRPQFAKPFTTDMDRKMDPLEVAAKHPFLNYASRFWSYHLVCNLDKYDPEMNDLILQLLQSRNILTCIEAISTFGNLSPLCRMHDNLRTWLQYVPSPKPDTRKWISVLPLGDTQDEPADSVIARWALDFRRIKQRFQHSLIRYPRTIHDSLPSFCPTNSMIFQLGASHTEISISDPSSMTIEWDNRLSMFRVPGFVRTMVCSPKRACIASAVDSPVVMVWDAETGQAIRPLKGHKDQVYALAYSKDEEYLVSGGKDESIIVWNVERGHELFKLKGHEGATHALAYNYSGEQIASGGADGKVRVWRVSEDGGRQQHVLSGHVGIVYTLKYHSDDIQLCSSADDGLVYVWNAVRGIKIANFDPNLKWMGRLSFHPSWHCLLTSSEREPNSLEIWNTETCEIVSKIPTPSPVRCWKYSPNGEYIVSGHLDGRVRVWESATGELLHTMNEDAWSLRFSHSGKYLVCLIRYISRWQIRTWDFDEEMRGVFRRRECGCGCAQKNKGGHRVIHALRVNMDNSRLATVTIPHAGTCNGRVKLWNSNTAEVLWEQEQVFRNHECVSPSFSPDGRFLACYNGKEEGGIILVDSIASAIVETIPVPRTVNLVSIAVDVDGRGLAIATREQDFLEDGETPSVPRFFLSRRSNGLSRPVDVVTTWGTQNSMALSYTADGMKLILAARDIHDALYIIVWDTETRKVIRRIVHDQERYIWFKMFGGFRLFGEDRVVIHVDYMPREAPRRSHWRERMLVLSPDGSEVKSFEAGSSRMTISDNRIIFLDSEFWIVSWDGHGTPKRHVKLPLDVGFAVSGLSFCAGKLTLVSRTEEITVVEVESLK